MDHSTNKGFSFGLTSGIITTLGLIIGLNSGTHSFKVVLSGILVIAVADAMSDAFGIHISEEAENQHTRTEIWRSTLVTFFSKFFFALLFIVPFLLVPLDQAIWVSVALGLVLIAAFSIYMAKQAGANPWYAVFEHLLIAVAVIVATHYIGDLVSRIE